MMIPGDRPELPWQPAPQTSKPAASKPAASAKEEGKAWERVT